MDWEKDLDLPLMSCTITIHSLCKATIALTLRLSSSIALLEYRTITDRSSITTMEYRSISFQTAFEN